MSAQEAGESVQLHNKTETSSQLQPPSQQNIINHSQKSGTVNNNQLARDREERLRLLKEKQNEERLRKLEELKQQAVIAQKFREQKEEERRKRIEELRLRDNDKRQQVVERKRQLWEVERDRREAIVRKNQEREARIESKKRNERSSIMFAFGSSTPRMLEPADTGGSYWASRRATSTNNVMTTSLYTPAPPPGPLTRRSSERELSDGNKKRATSAGGLLDYRSKDGEDFASGAVAVRYGAYRRKTDLMPTIPSSSSCRDSRTPGRAISMPRLDVLSPLRPLQSSPKTQTTLSPAKSMHSLGPRTVGADMLVKSADNSRSMLNIAPIPPPRLTRAERLRKRAKEVARTAAASSPASGSKSGDTTPSRPPSACSSVSSVRTRPQAAPRRPRPNSIAVTGVTSPTDLSSSRHSLSSEFRISNKSTEKPPLPKVHVTKKPMQHKQSLDITNKKSSLTSAKSSKQSSVSSTPALQSPTSDIVTVPEEFEKINNSNVKENKENVKTEEITNETQETVHQEKKEILIENIIDFNGDLIETVADAVKKVVKDANPRVPNSSPPNESGENDEMTQSLIAEKKTIATEEEAKAALAERRRLMREQQEREAELERQAQEAARLAELEALRKEEEEQRKLEEESLRIIEEAKRSEEARLLAAIQEAEQREEEERKRKEEEQRQKLEREELERKAKEEAEKQRIEMEIRLKKEEEERQARKKRVEAIMLRTRSKGSSANTPNKEENENNSEKNGTSTPNNYDVSFNETNNSNDSFSQHDNSSSKENESNGFNHTNGHLNCFSEKNKNEQNVVSNTIDVKNSHGNNKTNVDLLDLGIPTIIPSENNVNYNNSQVHDLLS